MFFKKIFQIIFVFIFIIFSVTTIFAQESVTEISHEEKLETLVQKVIEEKTIKPEGAENYQLYQKLEILVTKGSIKGQRIIVENGDLPVINSIKYKKNDKLIITYSRDLNGGDLFYIDDYIRRGPLIFLFLIFIILTILVARWRGVFSILAMVFSFSIIFYFILPKILSGSDPVLIAILGSLVIIPISFFLSHGFNKKTIVAIIGTLIALIITGLLAKIFVEFTKLTGLSSEEVGFLQSIIPGVINTKGLLLAGVIIGALGVLDDITISQSAIVYQLKDANDKLKFWDLYKGAMNVGRDHISSMVNTLILVYTGAALPLLLLFINNPHPFSEVVNYEIIAEELVRTLVGSIGLISAVPITTLIAVLAVKNNPKK